MGFYATEPAFSRGVGNGKRAVGFFRAAHRRNPPSRSAKSLAQQGFSAVVSRTSEPDAPLYGYRYYSPEMGRFPSRDPLGDFAFFTQVSTGKSRTERRSLREQARGPVYVFTGNSPISDVDWLGLVTFEGCSPEQERILKGKMTAVCETVRDNTGKLVCCLRKKDQIGAHWLVPCLVRACEGRDNLHYVCRDDTEGMCKNSCAWTYPFPWGKTIYICPHFWNSPGCNDPIKQACILLHELSHRECRTSEGTAYRVSDCCEERFWRQ